MDSPEKFSHFQGREFPGPYSRLAFLKPGDIFFLLMSLSSSSIPGSAVTPERILQMSWGFAPPLILEVAIQHQMFDFLDNTPGHTVAEVAVHTGGSERGWRAILNALASFQFLNKEEERYTTTPESSAFLVAGKPAFIGGLFKHTSRQLIPAWLQLSEIVKTGQPAQAADHPEHGEKFFAEFVSDIFNLSYPSARLLATHLQLEKSESAVSVLDLAAGAGVWGIALAQSSPRVHVIAVDWPGVLPVTRQHAERFGLGGQFSYRAGDLLEVEFPTGMDVATLGHIIHSEDAARSRALLKRVHAALKPGGTIAIAEFTPNATRTGPPQALIFAVNMLVNSQAGDTFPFVEVQSWLKESGFVDARELPCPGPAPLILATRG